VDVNEFNQTVAKTEHGEHVHFDLRPFGNRQVEAMELWLEHQVKEVKAGRILFHGKKIVLSTDASVVLSSGTRQLMEKLQGSGVNISLVRTP